MTEAPKRALRRETAGIYHIVDGRRVSGGHERIRGDATLLIGDVSRLIGDVTWLRGYVTGIRGDVTWLRGDVDECDITDEMRVRGVDVSDLVKQETA